MRLRLHQSYGYWLIMSREINIHAIGTLNTNMPREINSNFLKLSQHLVERKEKVLYGPMNKPQRSIQLAYSCPDTPVGVLLSNAKENGRPTRLACWIRHVKSNMSDEKENRL